MDLNIITDNWELISIGVGGALAIAAVVTRLTKSKKDDQIVEGITSLWQKLTGFFLSKKK